MIDVGYTVTTTGGIWSTLAAGRVVLTSVDASNQSGVDSSISLRLTKASGSAYIIPADLLPSATGSNSTHPRLPALPLEAGDKLEVTSATSVVWTAQGRQINSDRPYTRVASLTGGQWTTVSNLAGSVDALLFANTTMGEALVSARRSGGTAVPLFDDERVEEGASMRKIKVTVLSTGQSLQVKCSRAVDVVLVGVKA